MRNSLLVVLLLFVFCTSALAQSRSRSKKKDRRRFKASLVLGGYGTQVDGDLFVGFNKFGLSGGVRGTAVLSKHFDFDVELLYQQKGSRFESLNGGKRDRVLHLNYMEVPFLIRYYPTKKDKGVNLEIGFAYARRINSRIEEKIIPNLVSYESIAGDFTSNELSFLAGLAIKITPSFSLGGRYSYSFNRFYDNPEGATSVVSTGEAGETIRLLRNYMIGAYGAYTF